MLTTNSNWMLRQITDNPGTCQNCGAAIRWNYHIVCPGQESVVGSECVKALTHIKDPEAVRKAMFGAWRHRRKYFYKRIKGITWVIGQGNGAGYGWWLAKTTGVTQGEHWQFMPRVYDSSEAAKLAIARYAE